MNKDFEIVFDKEAQQKRMFHCTRGGVIRNKTIAEIAPNKFIPCIADDTIFARVEYKLNKMGFNLTSYSIPNLATDLQVLEVTGTNNPMAVVKAVAKAGMKADNIISIITENERNVAYPEGRIIVMLDNKLTNENMFGITFQLDKYIDKKTELLLSDILEKALDNLSGDEWNTFILPNTFGISKPFYANKGLFEFESEDEFYDAINDSAKSLENVIDKIYEMFKVISNSVKKIDNAIDKLDEMLETSESNNSSTALTDVNIGFCFHDLENTIEQDIPLTPFTVSDKFAIETEWDGTVKDIIPKTIYPIICGEPDNEYVTADILNSAMPLNRDASNIRTIDSKIAKIINNIRESDIDDIDRKMEIIVGGQDGTKYMTNRVFANNMYKAKVTITADINTNDGVKPTHNAVKMCVNPKSKNPKLRAFRAVNRLYIDIDTDEFFPCGLTYLSFMHLAYDINKIIWDNICNPDPSSIVYLCDSNGGDVEINTEKYNYAITHSLPVLNHDLTKSNQFEINTKIYAINKRPMHVPIAIPFEFKTTIVFEDYMHDDLDGDKCETV